MALKEFLKEHAKLREQIPTRHSNNQDLFRTHHHLKRSRDTAASVLTDESLLLKLGGLRARSKTEDKS